MGNKDGLNAQGPRDGRCVARTCTAECHQGVVGRVDTPGCSERANGPCRSLSGHRLESFRGFFDAQSRGGTPDGISCSRQVQSLTAIRATDVWKAWQSTQNRFGVGECGGPSPSIGGGSWIGSG
jgi:hypothetical protein